MKIGIGISLANAPAANAVPPEPGTGSQEISALSRFAIARATAGQAEIAALSRFTITRQP